MLVPGIHSDSKVKLQEEVCTGSLFGRAGCRAFYSAVFPQSLFFCCPVAGLRRAASALFFFPSFYSLVGTEEKQSNLLGTRESLSCECHHLSTQEPGEVT